MSDEYLENVAENIIDEIVDYDGRELKGFHRTMKDDLKDLLIESNPQLTLSNDPKLTILLLTSIHSTDPCSSCSENLANVANWANDNGYFGNSLRVLLLDSSAGFDEKKIWEKLKASFDDVPVTYFFGEDLGLIDVVQGTMSINYLERFWNSHFEE